MRNKSLLNLVAKISQSAARASAEANSWVLMYQPKMPKKLKK